MQSALIWNEIESIKYAVVDGDWTEFQDIYINSVDAGSKGDELISKVFDNEGQYTIEFVELKEFEKAIREGAVIVECGFIP